MRINHIDRGFLLFAAAFALIGLIWGLGMVVVNNYAHSLVHAHINLLGWVTLALYGIVYAIYPAMADSRLASPHFYCSVPGTMLMNVGWWMFIKGIWVGNFSLVLIFRGGSLLVILGALLFIINLWFNAYSRKR